MTERRSNSADCAEVMTFWGTRRKFVRWQQVLRECVFRYAIKTVCNVLNFCVLGPMVLLIFYGLS